MHRPPEWQPFAHCRCGCPNCRPRAPPLLCSGAYLLHYLPARIARWLPAATPMNLSPSPTAIGAVVCIAAAVAIFIVERVAVAVHHDKKGHR
jgi:hypothetical protein